MKSTLAKHSLKGLLAVLVVSLAPTFAKADHHGSFRGGSHGGWSYHGGYRGGYHGGWGWGHGRFGFSLGLGGLWGGYPYDYYDYPAYSSYGYYDYPAPAYGYSYGYYAPPARYYYRPHSYYYPGYYYGGRVTFHYR